MISSLTCRQLVLFDCDNGRLSIFKDHEKYLSQIPSSRECYIFWNDFKLPVYNKLTLTFKKYSQIHLCPSYGQQMDDSSRSTLLFFLGKLIRYFDSVLLVHGHDQSYECVLKCVTERYGKEKMKLQVINKPFSHHLPLILALRQKKNTENKSHGYLEISPSKEQTKHKRPTVFTNTILNYEGTADLYSLAKDTNLKRLTTHKQKSLKIDCYNTRLNNCKFSEEFDSDDELDQDYENYLSTMRKKIRSSILKIKLPKISYNCLQCPKKFKSATARNSHCNAKHARPNLLTNGEPSASRDSRSTLTKDQTKTIQHPHDSVKTFSCWKCPENFKSSLSRLGHFIDKHVTSVLSKLIDLSTHASNHITVVQDQIDDEKTTTDSIKRSFDCWQCTKKFQSGEILLTHFISKHASFIISTDTDPSSFLENQLVIAQERMKTTANTTILTKLSFSCSQCCKKFDSTTDLDQHRKAIHGQLNASSTADTMCSIEKQFEISDEKTKTAKSESTPTRLMFDCSQCATRFESAARRDLDLITAHRKSSSIIGTKSSNSSDGLTVIEQKQSKMTQHVSGSVNIFTCWQYFKKFESTTDVKQDLDAEHAVPTSIITTKQTSPLIDQTVPMQEKKTTEEYARKLTDNFISCSQCQEKFGSTTNRDIHFSANHVGSSLSATAKSPSSLDNRSTMTQDQTKTTQHTHDPVKAFSCSKCPMKFKSSHSRLDHFIKSHSASFLPTTNVSSNYPGNQTLPIQEQVNGSEVSISSLNKSCSCLECGKVCKSHGHHISHFIEKYAKTIQSTDIDAPGILKIQIATAQERMKTMKDTAAPTKPSVSCSQCSKKFKSDAACSNHFKSKHNGSTKLVASNQSTRLDNQITAPQEEMKAEEHPVDISSNCSRCLKEFISAADYSDDFSVEHVDCTSPPTIKPASDTESQTEASQEHTEVKSFIIILQEFLSDPGIMKCSKAEFSTVVYMLLGTIRKQICTSPGTTNRCLHETCNSKTVDYELGELWFHTTAEHKNAEFKLECCDPTTMYTPEEYRNHLLHPDKNYEILWHRK